jgi:hypothetical protein
VELLINHLAFEKVSVEVMLSICSVRMSVVLQATKNLGCALFS